MTINSSDIFSNGHTVLKRARHGYFLFNRNDLYIGRALDLYGEWCESEIEAIARLVQPGDLVVDIGANIGTHTIALANLVTATGLVIALEAQRQVYNYLVANVAINNLLHVLCMNNAAGASSGSVRVPLLNPAEPTNFGALNVASHESGEPVKVISVDSLGLPRCRLIKIDVEGMEPQVLLGAAETIERLKPIIFVETTLVNGREVIRILMRFGYACYWHIASYYNPDNWSRNPENVFLGIHPESNLLCIPRNSNIVISGLEKITGPEDNWQLALERIRGNHTGG